MTDHGLPTDTIPAGNPKVIALCDEPCPECESDKTCGVCLLVMNTCKELYGTLSNGHFRSCPVCNWTSAMWVIPRTESFTDYHKLS